MLEHPKAYGTHSVTIRMDVTMGNQQGRVARNPPSETGRISPLMEGNDHKQPR